MTHTNKVHMGVGEGWQSFGHRSQYPDLDLIIAACEQRGQQVFINPFGTVYVRQPGASPFEPMAFDPNAGDPLLPRARRGEA